jgi:hypothetical protein
MIHRNSTVAVAAPARPTWVLPVAATSQLRCEPVAPHRLWRYCVRRPMAAALSTATTVGFRLGAGRPIL